MPTLDPAVVKQRVRATAIWAAIAAALLLYFGYTSGFVYSDHPASRIGVTILSYTLKLGGWALVVAAVWLATGMCQALLYDAAVTALIGACFAAGGALWLAGGSGVPALLFVVFGVVFIGSGRGSWREYRMLTALASKDAQPGAGYAPPPDAREAPAAPPTGSLAGRVLERNRRADGLASQDPQSLPPEDHAPVADDATATTPEPVPPPPAEPPSPPPPDADEPAPEGFLAQFAPPEQRSDER